MKTSEALAASPPAPACFSSRMAWAEYLAECQRNTSRKVRRPFDGGVFQADFDFCRDCTKEHAKQMSNAGSCDPDQFRRVVRIKQEAVCS